MSHSDPAADPGTDPQYFTAEDVEKARREAIEQARKEERDKLYPQRDKQKEQIDAMQAEVKALREAEAARAKEADKAAKAVEAARQKAADAELSAKDLLEKRNTEWQAQLDAARADQAQQIADLKAQQELQTAMFAKNAEMAELAIYIRDRIADEKDTIAPELTDFITGDTKEQVDASIEVVKAKTAAIVEGMRQASIASRSGMPGVSPSGGATAIVPGLDTGDKKYTPEDIQGMSMQEYAALRVKMGYAQNGNGRGIFS
jgi:hypothetical protein